MAFVSQGSQSLSRLFAFGCSFTHYRWSTWADILAVHFDEYQNWGHSGGGNHFIFNSVMEADQRHKFGSGDTVVICWTNVMREDRYTDQWQTNGNITTCKYYDAEYVRKYVTERGNLVRDVAFIKATQSFLQNIPGLKYEFLSMCPLIYPDQYNPTRASGDTDIPELYASVLNNIKPSYYETVLNEDRHNGWKLHNWNTGLKDPHPTPIEHLAYLDWVLPGWVTNSDIRAKIVEETADPDIIHKFLKRPEITRL